MHMRIAPVLFLFTIAFQSLSSSQSTPELSDIRVTPLIQWSTTNGSVYSIQRASTITGDWTEVERRYSKTNGVARWADSTEIDSSALYYRVMRITGTPTGGFVETFEDSSGWIDHSYGSWTNMGSTGVWTADYCYATSAVIRAHSGSRYIGMNVNIAYLELPPVDNPTQVTAWVREVNNDYYTPVGLRYYDGINWNKLNEYSVRGMVYSQVVWNLNLGTPNPQQRLRIYGGAFDPLYVDDIEIKCAP